ncbi:YopX family protein [Paenibacillus sp. FSL R7-0048]|uniref:YopX family protein n=1 Tax=Paenibacillus sp. FSL R7-0048 TaxID=2954528 RepID=UPI0030F6CF2A
MGREIKYKAWLPTIKKMTYGHTLEQWLLDFPHLEDFSEDTVWLQYTGLNDKKGVEIYDGDIIDGSWINPMSQEKVIRQYKVTFNKGKYNAELIGHHPYGSTMLYFENENAEVIGNIYENPELIEV